MAASGVSSKCFGLFCRAAPGVGFFVPTRDRECPKRSPTTGTPPQTSSVTSSTSAVFPRGFCSLPTWRYIYIYIYIYIYLLEHTVDANEWDLQSPLSVPLAACPPWSSLLACPRRLGTSTQARRKQINTWISNSTLVLAKEEKISNIDPMEATAPVLSHLPFTASPFHQTRPSLHHAPLGEPPAQDKKHNKKLQGRDSTGALSTHTHTHIKRVRRQSQQFAYDSLPLRLLLCSKRRLACGQPPTVTLQWPSFSFQSSLDGRRWNLHRMLAREISGGEGGSQAASSPEGRESLNLRVTTFERSKILRRDIATHQARTQQIQDLRAACPSNRAQNVGTRRTCTQTSLCTYSAR